MRYIRTKDGRFIDLTSKQVSSYEIVDDKTAVDEYGEESVFICVYYYDEDIGEHIEYDGKGGRSMDNWYLKDIIKQADTIEELCDEFVFEDSDGHYLCNLCEQTDIDVGSKFDELVYWFNHSKEEQYKIRNCYGAIWTDKGLIYVAKMNEKGELELL